MPPRTPLPVVSTRVSSFFCAAALAWATFLGGSAMGQTESAVPASSSAPPPSLSVSAKAPGKGFLSAGVYDEKGVLIRHLLHAQPVEAGAVPVGWDATTDLGLPAAAGRYEVRGVWFPEPPKINFLMKVGLSGNPPYETPDDRGAWGGNLGAPHAICTNGKELLAVFQCVESPKTTGIQLMDMEGNITRRFMSFLPWDVRLAATMDETSAYVVIAGIGAKRLLIGKYDLDKPPRGRILCDLPAGPNVLEDGFWKSRWEVEVQGIALAGGRLYVPVLLDNKLFVVDANDGKILNTVDIPEPHGITATRDGRIFLATGQRVIELDKDGQPIGKPSERELAAFVKEEHVADLTKAPPVKVAVHAPVGKTVIGGGVLEAPTGMACDATGNLYVADGGNAQQIKVFTPQGRPLRTIGVKGGRPERGLYNPAGLRNPHGLCVTPDGRVWVANNAKDFQEITAWDKAGKRVKAFYNIYLSSGFGKLSPDRTELLAGSRTACDLGGMVAYKIDWAKNTWEPSWSYPMTPDMGQQNDVFLGYRLNAGQNHTAFNGTAPYLGLEGGSVRGPNGKTYLYGGDCSIWLLDEKTKLPRLVSLLYTHRARRLPDGRYEGAYDNQGQNTWLSWSDLNGDGKMALDECALAENPDPLARTQRLFGWQLEDDLSLTMLVPERIADAKVMPGKYSVLRLAPRQILPSGVPVYDWADVKLITSLDIPDYRGGNGGYKDPFRVETQGFSVDDFTVNVILNPGTKTKLKLSGIDGDGWWAGRNWRMTPMQFNLQNGEPSWIKLGKRAPGLAKPGEMYYPGWGLAGRADGVNYYADVMSQVWAWTGEDPRFHPGQHRPGDSDLFKNYSGLYLGHLYKEGGATHDADSIHVELIGSYVYKVGGPGKGGGKEKTVVLTGDHGISVHEITAPELTKLDFGPVTVTPDQAAAAKPWDPDGPAPGKRPTVIARSIYDFDRNAPKPQLRTITIDGKLDRKEWQGIAAVPLKIDGEGVGSLQVTFDKENLYLAYTFYDPNVLKNDGHELPLAPFASGGYVDFCLAPDWKEPNREQPADGDVRVILAKISNSAASGEEATSSAEAQNYQMAFWPVKSDLRFFNPKPKKLTPQEIASPAQTRHFDDIAPVEGLEFAYQIKPGIFAWHTGNAETGEPGGCKESGKFCTLEVKIPFAALGLNPARHSVIGFDAGVAFSNEAGTIRTRATHWAGESEATVVDRPGSAELKPATWGTLQLDRTPLGEARP